MTASGSQSSPEFVLDASVSLAWCFRDERPKYPQTVLDALKSQAAVVPSIWRIEMANALVVGERRGRCTHVESAAWIGFFSALPIQVDDETDARAWTDILVLARAQQIAAYDAAYLELAVRRGLPLSTIDEALKKKAVAMGIKLFRR